MFEIPDSSDKVAALYQYLSNNASDRESDSWHYGHNPVITAHLDSFSPTESNRLATEILQWDETTLYHLADPLSDVSNPNLDALYLYGTIFLKINNEAYLEYLTEHIHIVIYIEKGRHPADFYRDMETKTIWLKGKGICSPCYDDTIAGFKAKIRDEENNL